MHFNDLHRCCALNEPLRSQLRREGEPHHLPVEDGMDERDRPLGRTCGGRAVVAAGDGVEQR